MFRCYEIDPLVVNGTAIREVWIDPHYEAKHSESINDELILNLVRLLEQPYPSLAKVVKNGFEFFESELVWREKPYRLIWLLPPDRAYLGVRNAYRRSP